MVALNICMAKKKKEDREWKNGKGIKGTVRAAITHHPDKFDADCKDSSKLCPYAIFSAMKKKGFKPHYKDQKSTLKGKPKKKTEFKDEGSDCYSFKDYCDFREEDERKSLEKISAQSPKFPPGTKMAPPGPCPHCQAPVSPGNEEGHFVDCPNYMDWQKKKIAKRRAAKDA